MSISSKATGLRPGVCTSTTRPTSPYLGQLIFETDTFAMNFWNGSAWQGAISAPAGTVNSYAGSTAPTGWLLCAGQNVSRNTYAGLFAAIGTTYGSGDGSTTFALPDLRGRVVAGVDNMGGSAASRLTSTVLSASNTIGATGGAQTHGLSSSEMPSHAHNVVIRRGAVASTPYTIYQLQTITTGAWSDETFTTTSAGSGTAHLNTQPTMVMNYIIKF